MTLILGPRRLDSFIGQADPFWGKADPISGPFFITQIPGQIDTGMGRVKDPGKCMVDKVSI